jgi:aspartate aminotransferase
MFQKIPTTPPDAILGLNEAFLADRNPRKVNLTLGVYVDDSGQTPILQCVKSAERLIWEQEDTKLYLNIAGLAEFREQVECLVLGEDFPDRSLRARSLQTPGGTCALRVVADFVHSYYPESTVWITSPSWPNHPSIFHAAQVRTSTYPYLNSGRDSLDLDAVLSTWADAAAGDFVLLHGCCHNPTGIDADAPQWRAIADFLQQQRLIPIIDLAYQGFGRTLDEDATGVRILATSLDEVVICSSFSKTFGLYRERVGALTTIASGPRPADRAFAALKQCVRRNYSNPPSHGAAVVATILSDAMRRAGWVEELNAMTRGIRQKRKMFVAAVRDADIPLGVEGLLDHNGMFSLLPLAPSQIDELREQYGVYLVRDGRINLAGLRPENLAYVVSSLQAALSNRADRPR